MNQPGRKFAQGSGYRYGFNGKENDKDISEGGQDYGMRIYDAAVGRFLSVDPITRNYPELTPYQFASNTPVVAIDIDGKEAGIPNSNYTPSGVPLSQHFMSSEGRKAWGEAMGIGVALGGAIVVDIFFTKGKLTTFLYTSILLGHLHHNGTSNPEEQRRRSADLTNDLIGLGSGYILGKSLRALRLLYSEGKTLFNFGSKALGEMGEEALARQYGTIKPSGKGSTMNTSTGPRKPDGIPLGTNVSTTDKLFESKVGYQEYNGNVLKQVEKDAELLSQGQVKEVTWVFYKSPNTGKIGASDELLLQLKNAGIKTQVAGEIPKDIIQKAIIKYAPTTKQ